MSNDILAQNVVIDALPILRLNERLVIMRVFWTRGGLINSTDNHILNVNGVETTYTANDAKVLRYSKRVAWDTSLPLDMSIQIGDFKRSARLDPSTLNIGERPVEDDVCIRGRFRNIPTGIKFQVYSAVPRVATDARRVKLYKATLGSTPAVYKVSHVELANYTVSNDYTDYSTLYLEGEELISNSTTFTEIYGSRSSFLFKISDQSGNEMMWPNQPVLSTPSINAIWAPGKHIGYDTMSVYIAKGNLNTSDTLSIQVAIRDDKNNHTGFSNIATVGETLSTLMPLGAAFMDGILVDVDTTPSLGQRYTYKYEIEYMDLDKSRSVTETVSRIVPVYTDIDTVNPSELINPSDESQLSEHDFVSGVAPSHMRCSLSNDPNDYDRYRLFKEAFKEIDEDDVCSS